MTKTSPTKPVRYPTAKRGDAVGIATDDPVVEVKNLHTWFPTAQGPVRAVNGVNLTLQRGQRLAIIGESGCGKSVLTQTLFRLLPPTARYSGKMRICNYDIDELSDKEMQELRGSTLGLIPQHLSSLNPLFRIGSHVAEAISPKVSRLALMRLKSAAADLLHNVSLDRKNAQLLPHELSGGMNRRVLISMGTAQNPPLLVADEPTSGLDRILRSHIVELLDEITVGKTLLMITHDIDVARFCDTVAVMYAGKIIEQGPMEQVLESPRHPYTRGLLASMPERGLEPIGGVSPSLIDLPSGCSFHPRCDVAIEQCSKICPKLRPAADSAEGSCEVSGHAGACGVSGEGVRVHLARCILGQEELGV